MFQKSLDTSSPKFENSKFTQQSIISPKNNINNYKIDKNFKFKPLDSFKELGISTDLKGRKYYLDSSDQEELIKQKLNQQEYDKFQSLDKQRSQKKYNNFIKQHFTNQKILSSQNSAKKQNNESLNLSKTASSLKNYQNYYSISNKKNEQQQNFKQNKLQNQTKYLQVSSNQDLENSKKLTHTENIKISENSMINSTNQVYMNKNYLKNTQSQQLKEKTNSLALKKQQLSQISQKYMPFQENNDSSKQNTKRNHTFYGNSSLSTKIFKTDANISSNLTLNSQNHIHIQKFKKDDGNISSQKKLKSQNNSLHKTFYQNIQDRLKIPATAIHKSRINYKDNQLVQRPNDLYMLKNNKSQQNFENKVKDNKQRGLHIQPPKFEENNFNQNKSAIQKHSVENDKANQNNENNLGNSEQKLNILQKQKSYQQFINKDAIEALKIIEVYKTEEELFYEKQDAEKIKELFNSQNKQNKKDNEFIEFQQIQPQIEILPNKKNQFKLRQSEYLFLKVYVREKQSPLRIEIQLQPYIGITSFVSKNRQNPTRKYFDKQFQGQNLEIHSEILSYSFKQQQYCYISILPQDNATAFIKVKFGKDCQKNQNQLTITQQSRKEVKDILDKINQMKDRELLENIKQIYKKRRQQINIDNNNKIEQNQNQVQNLDQFSKFLYNIEKKQYSQKLVQQGLNKKQQIEEQNRNLLIQKHDQRTFSKNQKIIQNYQNILKYKKQAFTLFWSTIINQMILVEKINAKFSKEKHIRNLLEFKKPFFKRPFRKYKHRVRHLCFFNIEKRTFIEVRNCLALAAKVQKVKKEQIAEKIVGNFLISHRQPLTIRNCGQQYYARVMFVKENFMQFQVKMRKFKGILDEMWIKYSSRCLKQIFDLSQKRGDPIHQYELEMKVFQRYNNDKKLRHKFIQLFIDKLLVDYRERCNKWFQGKQEMKNQKKIEKFNIASLFMKTRKQTDDNNLKMLNSKADININRIEIRDETDEKSQLNHIESKLRKKELENIKNLQNNLAIKKQNESESDDIMGDIQELESDEDIYQNSQNQNDKQMSQQQKNINDLKKKLKSEFVQDNFQNVVQVAQGVNKFQKILQNQNKSPLKKGINPMTSSKQQQKIKELEHQKQLKKLQELQEKQKKIEEEIKQSDQEMPKLFVFPSIQQLRALIREAVLYQNKNYPEFQKDVIIKYHNDESVIIKGDKQEYILNLQQQLGIKPQ